MGLVLLAATAAAASCPSYRAGVPPDKIEAADDAELQARWATFREALGRTDVSAALDCVRSVRRGRYEASLKTLFVDNRTRVDEVLTAIRPVRARSRSAVYEMTRRQDGREQSFDVGFAVDLDGVWRIESF